MHYAKTPFPPLFRVSLAYCVLIASWIGATAFVSPEQFWTLYVDGATRPEATDIMVAALRGVVTLGATALTVWLIFARSRWAQHMVAFGIAYTTFFFFYDVCTAVFSNRVIATFSSEATVIFLFTRPLGLVALIVVYHGLHQMRATRPAGPGS